MSEQAVDRTGAADYLKLSAAQVNARIKNGTFPRHDKMGSANSPDTEWWTIDSLDKYRRSLSAKKAAATRRRNNARRQRK